MSEEAVNQGSTPKEAPNLAPIRETGKQPKGMDPDGVTLMVGLVMVIGAIVCAVGVGMALMPSSANPYAASATADLLKVAVRQENGRMLAVVGAILATGTGIVLAVRSSKP